VLRVETQAVHRGEFHGFAPTGKRVTLGGIVIYRIANGRIAESWAELNFGRLIQQLRA
jgi:predicted ester cyclase